MTDKLIVGIDIGKRTHVATIIDHSGAVIGRAFSFANTTIGANLLLERIIAVNPEHLPIVFGLEATGHYWLALYSFLTGKGYPVSVINPYQSDAFRKVHLSTTKTDKEDSFLIADLMRFGSFQETKMAGEQMVSLRNLESFESITTRKLTNVITKLSKGRFKKEKAEEIKQKASVSFGVDFALDSFKLELSLLLKQLDFLTAQIAVVESEIGQSMETIPTTLKTLPGVDTILAAAIISEIGDITRFQTSAQLVSFAGINPTVHQSGQFTGNKNHMSKKGSPYLRLALWRASVTSVRFNPILKTYYEQKIKEGKNHMTVIGAVSRKLTGIIFAMMRDNKKFDETARPLV